jgi:hypothetical protein
VSLHDWDDSGIGGLGCIKQRDLSEASRVAPGVTANRTEFNRSHRLGDPLSATLLRLFAVLWQIKVDEAKAGGSSVRLVDPHDAVLMQRACANFVIRGGVCFVAN